MPSNWLSIDSNFPSFTGEESTERQIMALHNYLFQLREGLQYSLQNLTADNFNTAALHNLSEAQKNEMTEQLKKVYTQLNQMAVEIDRLSSRVVGAENLQNRMEAAEENAGKLDERIRLLEEDKSLEDLQAAVAGEGGLQERTKALEDTVTGEGGLQERTKALEDTVTGEGGLQEQMTKLRQELEKISGALQVAEDGSVTVGSEGIPLRLVGQVYINGVLYEQGGTA